MKICKFGKHSWYVESVNFITKKYAEHVWYTEWNFEQHDTGNRDGNLVQGTYKAVKQDTMS